jgi:hypothetical protein
MYREEIRGAGTEEDWRVKKGVRKLRRNRRGKNEHEQKRVEGT